jgi:nucleoprotein TPR
VEKANAEVMPSSKYAQLLESVEAIPALNESNRVLRQTKEKLEKEIVDINVQLDEAAKSVEPLKQQLREAEERQDKLEAELEAMQGDNQRWRQRANQLIEKNQVFI